MSGLEMTPAEREAFLAEVHVGVLSIARRDRGPLALPIWYSYEPGGDVVLSMDRSSMKARLLGNTGRASLVVQDERPPYRYVMVEGPVTMETPRHDIAALATRYLGEEMGARYAAANPASDDTVEVVLRPEQWLSVDYRKMT